MTIAGGIVADVLRKKFLSTKSVRKILNTSGKKYMYYCMYSGTSDIVDPLNKVITSL